MLTDKQASDAAITFHGVDPRGEGQDRPLLRGGKLHLGQIVDEEV